MDISKSLQSRRHAAGLTWKALSQKSGVSERTLKSWLLGADPSLGRVVRVARALKVSVDRLVKEADHV